MTYNNLGRLGWQVSRVGYGMFGMNTWSESDVKETIKSLNLAIELGCNFIDTAWIYGKGRAESILGDVVKTYPNKHIYIASKVPPKNMTWPSLSHFTLNDTFPPEHIIEYVEKSLKNLNLDTIDLMQLHVWEDSWVKDDRWLKTMEKLKRSGKINGIGISLNRWEPNNGIEALRTGIIDTVQVVYNIFDQAPEDKLFKICDELNIGVLARCPFDEGGLIGNFTKDSTWAEGDFRRRYFCYENLIPTVERAEALNKIAATQNMSLPEMNLRFILSNKTVSTVIPGMRKINHVKDNININDGKGLPLDLIEKLKAHRWDRKPTKWSA